MDASPNPEPRWLAQFRQLPQAADVFLFFPFTYCSVFVNHILELFSCCSPYSFGGLKNLLLLQPKYITKLLDKAKARQQEQEIIYERKLLKEREREDHLYGDKDKFVTTAYKQKLAEQAKWIEEERIRELREQANEVCLCLWNILVSVKLWLHKKMVCTACVYAHTPVHVQCVSCAYKYCLCLVWFVELCLLEYIDWFIQQVTNKKDLSDFYHNLLSKNVAFGASKSKVDRAAPPELLQVEQEMPAEVGGHSRGPDRDKSSEQEEGQVLEVQSDTENASLDGRGSSERLLEPERTSLGALESEPDAGEGSHKSLEKDLATEGQPISANAERKPSQDAISAAKERFLARKRMRTT